MRAVAFGKMAWPRIAAPRERRSAHHLREPQAAEGPRKLAELVESLKLRQAEGKETTLRQLHAVSQTDQPRALRLLRELQVAGLANIEPDLHDPLASVVALTPEAFGSFDEVLLQD